MELIDIEKTAQKEGLCRELYQQITSFIVNERGNSRSSIWYYNKYNSGLECQVLYDNRDSNFIAGFSIYEEDCPEYFSEVASGNTIVANNARQDPITEDFTDEYFEPNDIFSLLDVPIIDKNNKIRGVICCEHCAELRFWSQEDIAIAQQTAKIIGDLL